MKVFMNKWGIVSPIRDRVPGNAVELDTTMPLEDMLKAIDQGLENTNYWKRMRVIQKVVEHVCNHVLPKPKGQ